MNKVELNQMQAMKQIYSQLFAELICFIKYWYRKKEIFNNVEMC